MRFETQPFLRGLRRLASLGLAALSLACAGAQMLPEAGGEPKVLRRVSEFWNLPLTLREKTQRADFAVTVFYFDPDWGLLWGEDDGTPFFLPMPMIDLPIRNGERVRLRGWVSSKYFVAEPDEIERLPQMPPRSGVELPNSDETRMAKLNNCLVEGRAYVESQEMVDARHMAYRAVIGNRLVNIWLRIPQGGEAAPLLAGSLVRFRGVCSSKADSRGGLLNAEIWIGSAADLKNEGTLREDKRFEIPATPAEKVKDQPEGKLVRVAGRVRGQEPGYTVTLWDETGQVLLETAQASLLRQGSIVEAIGYPTIEGPTVKLTRALFRDIERPEAVLGPKTRHPDAPLRLVEQINELSPSEAAGNRAVHIEAVVTWAPKNRGDAFYVQDATDGIRVVREEDDPIALAVGDLVDIEGVSGAGKDAPIVRSRRVAKQAGIYLPKPIPVTLEQARAGVGFSKRVEISGFLRETETLPNGSLRLWLTTTSGDFSALLPAPGSVREWTNAVVSVRGVCKSAVDAQRKLADVEILAASPQDVSLVGLRPADLFSLPSIRLSDLGQTRIFSSQNQWVRTQGIVTLARPGHSVTIQDGEASLQASCRAAEVPKPGTRIDVVGLLGTEQTRHTLREAVFRVLGQGGPIHPVVLRAPFELRPELDGCLAKVKGELVEQSRRPGATMFVLRSENSLCEAWLDGTFQAAERLPGSVLEATGVYMVVRDEFHRPWSFRLQLRSTDDVTLISAPPWLTLGRALVALGALAGLAVAVLLWSALLRRKVKLQTGVIREQMLKENRLIAELERSSRLESLGTLAGGIAHDFNNILTIIVCNLSLLRQETDLDDNARGLISEAENGANRARTLTRQLLTFARGGTPLRRPHELEPVVKDAVSRAPGGARFPCSYTFAPELWPVLIDREQFTQALQAILFRGVEGMRSGAGFTLRAENEEIGEEQVPGLRAGRYVKLVVEDDGGALPAEQIERIFDPYFLMKGDQNGMGLATARSIVKRHEGSIEAFPLDDRGMAFRLWLPASEPPERREEAVPDDKPKKNLSSTRILFMDDEEPIQLIAAALFKRMGCEATIVGEGAQALAAYEAARDQGRPFDLVIVDLLIPNGMGGRELIERLLQLEPSLRAIVSSGYSNDPVMANYADYGFVAVVPKPYLIEDMEQAIRLALAAPAQARKPRV